VARFPYNDEKRELFDEFFVYKALDELIPLSENDFTSLPIMSRRYLFRLLN
jgi:hypothetical protein